MSDNLLTVEIDGPRNEALFFRPLARRIRGRFDFARDSEPMARTKASEWPEGIPGQRLAIDLESGEGAIGEPLQYPEHEPLKQRLESKGFRVPPVLETFPAQDIATWVFWIKQAIDAGLARIVGGKLPAKLPGVPRMNFLFAPAPASANDRLAAAIDKQTALLERLLSKG